MVFFIIHEFIQLERKGQAPQVYSAVAQPSIRGYVYVEARSLKDVALVCQNFISNHGTIQIISIEDALAVLGVTPHFRVPEPETWVRIKHGTYAGDIGFVRAVVGSSDKSDENDSSGFRDCIVSVIPQISDPRLPKDKRRVGEKRKFHPAVQGPKDGRRPQAAFFDANATIARMTMAGLDKATIAKRKPIARVAVGGCLEWQYRRNVYIKGLLDLVIPAQVLNFIPSNPTAIELRFWSQCEDLHVREQALHGLVQFQVFIWPGDRVEAISGPYRTLQGEVIDTDGTVIVVHFSIADMPPQAYLKAMEVRKIFKPGDYVQVMGGMSDGKEGLVVAASDEAGTVDILESGTNSEVVESVHSP